MVAILRNLGEDSDVQRGRAARDAASPDGRLDNVRIDTFDGLMVEYAKSIDAKCVLRGIRAISDYEYELQMALMNRKLEPTLETVFMMPAVKYSYVSSRLVREVAQAGGPVKDLVPDACRREAAGKIGSCIQTSGRAQSSKSREKGRRRHDHGQITAEKTRSAETDGTNQPDRALRHHGGGGRGRQAAAAGNRRGRFWRRRAAFRDAAAH